MPKHSYPQGSESRSSAMDPSSLPPLIGTLGDLVHRSSDDRYEIRSAIMTTFPAAAIVNATNLAMTSNTANVPGGKFQITRGAGPELLQYLYNNHPKGLPVGEAVTSPNFDLLNCCHIIHTNVPNYRGRTRSTMPLLRQQLVDCYRRCLEEAYKICARSIAFPCLGAGFVLGWRRRDASRIGLNTVKAWFKHPIHGAARRARIPGPVYFLADPVGPYERQADAWIAAFEDIWPPGHSSLLSSIEGPRSSRLPPVIIRTKKILARQNRIQRGRGKRGPVSRITTKDAQYQDSDRDLDKEDAMVPPTVENKQDKETSPESDVECPRKTRRIGQQEVKKADGVKGSQLRRSARQRKPPERYGF